MSVIFTTHDQITASANIIPIYVLRPSEWDTYADSLTASHSAFAQAQHFKGSAGQLVLLPDVDGSIAAVLFGAGRSKNDEQGAIRAGGLSSALSAGYYQFERLPEDWGSALTAIGWGLGAYKYEQYLKKETQFPTLVLDGPDGLSEIVSLTEASRLCRDLINTPAGDMGPEALHQAAADLANEYGASQTVTIGEDLLSENYPMIHAVGRAAHEAPRLVEFEWGNPDHPRLALIGKGITFDTGGLNIKSAVGALSLIHISEPTRPY